MYRPQINYSHQFECSLLPIKARSKAYIMHINNYIHCEAASVLICAICGQLYLTAKQFLCVFAPLRLGVKKVFAAKKCNS